MIVILETSEEKRPKLPCIMEGKTESIVVLANGINLQDKRFSGMVLFTQNTTLGKGDYCENFNLEDFTLFKGTLKISNE